MLSYIRHNEELPFRRFEGSRVKPVRDEEHGRGERDEEGGLRASEGCCSAGEERSHPQQWDAASGAHCLERVVDTRSRELVDHGGCLLFKKAGAIWRHIPSLQIRCPYSKEPPCSHKTQPVFSNSHLSSGVRSKTPPQSMPKTANSTEPYVYYGVSQVTYLFTWRKDPLASLGICRLLASPLVLWSSY